MKTIHDVSGMAQLGQDGCPVGFGSVGDHHFDSSAPAVTLGGQESPEGLGVSVFDHPQGLSGLPVEKDRHVAASAPVSHHHSGPRRHQPYDEMPSQTPPAGQLPDRQTVDILDQGAGQTPG